MSILDFFNLWTSRIRSHKFYQNAEVVDVDWGYSWCHEYPDLYFARLRTFSNGKADVLFQDETKSYGFDTRTYAANFISEDEFSRFVNIDEEDRHDLGIPIDTTVTAPDWEAKEAIDFEYIGEY